jgi:hypothetical protein
VSGICDVTLAPDDTPLQAGTMGDCKKNVCKDGKPAVLPDDTDLVPDNDPCTMEMCNGGVKQAGPAPDGTACGDTGKLACVEGLCKGCAQDPTNCNAPTDCQTVECPVNTCMYTVLEGKEILDADQTDCTKIVCDAAGNQATVGDEDDTPPQTGDICKKEICAADGSIATTNDAEGMDCGNPMDVCYNEPVCNSGTCAQKPKSAGTKAMDNNKVGDCKSILCDGNGGTMEGPDDADVPTDMSAGDCSTPGCLNGMVTNTTKPKGDVCTSEMNGKCCGTNCCANAVGGVPNYCDKTDMCCPSNKTCNGVCCMNTTASCINNACCETTVCNNVCCPTTHACDNNACCPATSQCPNGTCCPSGQMCKANNTCMP